MDCASSFIILQHREFAGLLLFPKPSGSASQLHPPPQTPPRRQFIDVLQTVRAVTRMQEPVWLAIQLDCRPSTLAQWCMDRNGSDEFVGALLRGGQIQVQLLPVLNGMTTTRFGHRACLFFCIQYTNLLDIA
jgi:hypothetical protein